MAHTSDAASQHVVVIGGGLAGLSAAYELIQSGAAVTLLERGGRLGGKLLTEQIEAGGTWLVEGGADSFVGQKPWAIDLALALGLGDELTTAVPRTTTTYILRRGRPVPLPAGLSLIVPTNRMALLRSPLLSPLGKLRLLCEPLVAARVGESDESVASFVRRRMGREALERLAEPILGGIHSADVERQSLLGTFPRFAAMEREHGSLLRASRFSRRRSADLNLPNLPQRSPKTAPTAAQRDQLAASPFVTLRGGMQTLTEALAAAVRRHATVRLDTEVVSVERDRLPDMGYRVRLHDGTTLTADAVVLTAPTHISARLVRSLAPALAEQLGEIRSVSTATVALGYATADVGLPLDGYGLVIPRGERRPINAVTMVSHKFAGRAPDGGTLIRVFAGGSRTPASYDLDDDSLVAMARAELASIFGIEAVPQLARVYRWERANPQYDVGHLGRVAAIRAACPEGLELAGCAYDGVGVPDVIRSGREAGRKLLDTVTGRDTVRG